MENKKSDFSQGSMAKAIIRMAVPMIFAQLIQLLYNIVDRVYMGRLPVDGRQALTAIGICLPIVSIFTGFANLCGVGGGPLCSMARGRGDTKDAEHIMGNSFFMLLIIGVLLTVVGLIIKKPMLYLFGASDATYSFANEYLTIYLIGTVFVMISIGMNPFINLQGFPKIGMMTVALGAIINLVLDPIFIFALKMGIRGNAISTIFAQFCSAVWVVLFLTGKKGVLRLKVANFKLKLKTVTKILSLGVSGFMLAFTTSLVQILCNKTLQTLGGDLYVTAMTVINAIREFGFVAVHGLTNGAGPVLSFNYGARKYDRLRSGIRVVTLLALTMSLISWALINLFPTFFIKIFNNEAELLEVAVPAFKIYFAAFFMMSLQLSGQAVSLSMGRAKTSIFFSLLRKAIIVAPLVLLLPRIESLGINGVFWSEPISDIVGGLACYTTMLIVVYFPLGKLNEGDPPEAINGFYKRRRMEKKAKKLESIQQD